MTRQLLLILVTLMALPAMAKVQISRTRPIVIPQGELPTALSKKDLEKIIPMDMAPTGDATVVATRIGDGALQAWLKSPQVQGTAFAQTAQKVESTMKAEVSLKGDQSEEGVDHRVGFQYMLLQTTAKLEYKGWVRAALNHNTRSRESHVEVSETIMKDKDLFLSHRASVNEGSTSSVGVKWSW